MATTGPSTTLTDFLRHSRRFLAHIDDGEIFLRRREGDDLIVLTRRHWDALADGVRLASSGACASPAGGSAPSEDRSATFALPWMALLTPEDRSVCIEEVGHETVAALESGGLGDLATLLDRWRATVLATWDAEQKRDRPEYGVEESRPLGRP